MAIKYRINVGDVLDFPVKFTLRDGAKDRPFGMRLTANRVSVEAIEAERASGISVADFLKARNLTMQAWIGDSPLVDAETGQPVPPGPETLQAAMDNIEVLAGLIYLGYMEANGAKGKQGN